MIQLLKFAVDDSWVPYKLDVEVGMPDHLELSKLAGNGLQPGEEVLPDDEPVKKEVSEKLNQFGPILAFFGQIWAILAYFGPIWSTSCNSIPFSLILVHFDPFWPFLTQFNPI